MQKPVPSFSAFVCGRPTTSSRSSQVSTTAVAVNPSRALVPTDSIPTPLWARVLQVVAVVVAVPLGLLVIASVFSAAMEWGAREGLSWSEREALSAWDQNGVIDRELGWVRTFASDTAVLYANRAEFTTTGATLTRRRIAHQAPVVSATATAARIWGHGTGSSALSTAASETAWRAFTASRTVHRRRPGPAVAGPSNGGAVDSSSGTCAVLCMVSRGARALMPA
jgi:hypothetical protein